MKDPSASALTSRIEVIDYLFDGLSAYGNEDRYLSFTHDFLKRIPYLKRAKKSFSNLKLAHTLPYDFFNKRKYNVTKVYLSSLNDQ